MSTRPRPKFRPVMPAPRLNGDGNLVICLPIPDAAISPNARRGQSKWAAMVKGRKIRVHRTMAFASMLDAISLCLGGVVPKAAGYSLTHYSKTKAYRDDDNADGACKAYRDGMADALGMNDRDLRKVALSLQGKDAKCPRVEITVFLKVPEMPGNCKKPDLGQHHIMKPTKIKDEFRGDDAHLCQSIKALIELSDAKALAPHGLGGHARNLLASSYRRLKRKSAQWYPINTAPKDGHAILALLADSDLSHTIRWRVNGWEIAWDQTPLSEHDQPIRWMPLPSSQNAGVLAHADENLPNQ